MGFPLLRDSSSASLKFPLKNWIPFASLSSLLNATHDSIATKQIAFESFRNVFISTKINRFTNKRVQVSYFNDFIRVYFKEKKDAYYEAQVKKLFDTITRDLGQYEAILMFQDMIPQPTEKPYDLDENEEIN